MSPSLDPHLRHSMQLDVDGGAHSARASPSPLKRSWTPNVADDHLHPAVAVAHARDRDAAVADERRRARLKDLYERSERMITGIFAKDAESHICGPYSENDKQPNGGELENSSEARPSDHKPQRTARQIDEDDYGDDDEEEDHPQLISPLQRKDSSSSKPAAAAEEFPSTAKKSSRDRNTVPTSSADHAKTSEEARKKLEEEKQAKRDAAKESFQNMFYTLENDRDAMLEQQKLDELDRQVETEMSGQGSGNAGSGANPSGAPQQGSLSSANLGASSLTLKHLISRIDARRNMVKASDSQLRSLMSEVRKNRSKWASEERVGQEELYESAERVLMELKAMTEWAAPFLQKVNKRDAPDYYNIIKHPMDIGTMLKKLKQLQYQSKKQFVDDLELIWSNCLKYNANPEHFLRKKAEHMRRETARLTPLIPDIVIRDRAEVEAEERRLQNEFEDGEDSEEEPLINTRGRKAPGKSSKKGPLNARKAPSAVEESSNTPGPEPKPGAAATGSLGALANLKSEHFRSDGDSTTEVGSQHGLSTPPGTMTPVMAGATSRNHIDVSELEDLGPAINGSGATPHEEPEQEDEEYQTWKQVTKKDRARVAAERQRLFQPQRINPDEPALLRTKSAMRRWLRLQKAQDTQDPTTGGAESADEKATEQPGQGTTLAEGMEPEDDSMLPDYYDPLACIPQLNERLAWTEDSEGQVIDPKEECLRMASEGHFVSPRSVLSTRIETNLRQMQDTRKVMAKIGVVKQMQLQSQLYQNQFQKYNVAPFSEADVGPIVVSDNGPIVAPYTARAALQRSIGKIFYHAGFEDVQPSALETLTDLTSEYFVEMVRTLGVYTRSPQVDATETSAASSRMEAREEGQPLKPRFTQEEAVLHTLYQFSHDLESLEAYCKDDLDRVTTRLEAHHSRTKDYLSELLRPALDPATVGNDGAGAFKDGNEQQFVAGDFAEDIGEDFFGFKELGLDKEFGIDIHSVPLHLLQSRVHNHYQPTSTVAMPTSGQIMENLPPYPALGAEALKDQIGLVQEFFKNRLEQNNDEPLIEDDDLPLKQRYPKPRLPPTGKISSPRKRPIREQQMMARKKRRLEIEAEKEKEREAVEGGPSTAEPDGGAVANDSAPLPNGDATASKDNSSKANKSKASASKANEPTTEAEKSTAKSNEPTADETTTDTVKPDDKAPVENTDEPAVMVNGDTTTGHSNAEDPPPGPSPDAALAISAEPVVGEEQVNGEAEEPKEPDASTPASKIKLDLSQQKQLQPNVNATASPSKSGDPEKKDRQPPVDANSSEAGANDAEGILNDNNEDEKDNPDNAGSNSVADEGGDEDDDPNKTGMLSPESVPIAAH